jgi:hypothetical protein
MPYGHREQLSSGLWRAKVYAGKDPLSGRVIQFRKTRRTEVEAQIELGKLLELARSGRQPDSDIYICYPYYWARHDQWVTDATTASADPVFGIRC